MEKDAFPAELPLQKMQISFREPPEFKKCTSIQKLKIDDLAQKP